MDRNMSDPGLRVELRQAAPIALNVDLSCAPGELLALVGPSGSGKSTVLRMIAGLARPREGRIVCDGEDWFESSAGINLAPQRRRIGMVFQHYALFPHLNAVENVMEALVDRPGSERRANAQAWIERLHLHGLEARRPSQLSGGQQQRVAVARALAREPRVLLLDEPFSAVDRVTRDKLHEELAQLRRDLSMPVILVTHDLDEALKLADRMTVLSQGKTLQSGTPVEVLTRPDTVQIARLAGHKNVFRGGVLEHRHDDGVTVIEWRGHRLHAGLQTRFAPGSQVAWMIPKSHLLLDVPDGEPGSENRVDATVGEAVRLGETVSLTVLVDGPSRPPLFASASLHLVQAHRLTAGRRVSVSFLAGGIHLMPPDRQRKNHEIQ